MNATAKLLSESALQVFECETPDCHAVATRGSYCPSCAIACTGCWQFFAAAELTDEQCAHCRRQACGEEIESLAGARCWCGGHKENR